MTPPETRAHSMMGERKQPAFLDRHPGIKRLVLWLQRAQS